MLASDTAYPRLKTSFNTGELEWWYSPTPDEREFCTKVVRGQSNRFGFLLTLKTMTIILYRIFWLTAQGLAAHPLKWLCVIEVTKVKKNLVKPSFDYLPSL